MRPERAAEAKKAVRPDDPGSAAIRSVAVFGSVKMQMVFVVAIRSRAKRGAKNSAGRFVRGLDSPAILAPPILRDGQFLPVGQRKARYVNRLASAVFADPVAADTVARTTDIMAGNLQFHHFIATKGGLQPLFHPVFQSGGGGTIDRCGLAAAAPRRSP